MATPTENDPDTLPSDGDGLPTGASNRRLHGGQSDALVREEPLLLVIHGQQLLTMRTPGHDQLLGLGFLLGEGIIATKDDVASLSLVAGDRDEQRPDELHVTLTHAPDSEVRKRLARTHEIRSSCGVCGLTDPEQILEGTDPLLPGVPRIPRTRISELLAELERRQKLFRHTGGSHGALVADSSGNVLGFGEDVGRHNALDKAIGEATNAGADLAQAIAVLSGRAGYDLVVKCLRVRLPVIVSVSAPSTLAFELCEAAGATLVGFARGEDHRIYCDGSHRIG